MIILLLTAGRKEIQVGLEQQWKRWVGQQRKGFPAAKAVESQVDPEAQLFAADVLRRQHGQVQEETFRVDSDGTGTLLGQSLLQAQQRREASLWNYGYAIQGALYGAGQEGEEERCEGVVIDQNRQEIQLQDQIQDENDSHLGR